MLNLDTHMLLHALAGTLRPAERGLLERDEWSVSAIVQWEICRLQQLGRIELDLDLPEVSRILHRLHTWPLTWEICRASCRLDVRGDPADELIAATSIVHNVPLVTRDRALRKSKQIPLARLRKGT
jgi:PIN domain nuclease of toxin-antitoxin system